MQIARERTFTTVSVMSRRKVSTPRTPMEARVLPPASPNTASIHTT
jgi:hypothetical protein